MGLLDGDLGTDRYDDMRKTRKPIPKGIIKEVLNRSKGKCEDCKTSLDGLKPELHHKNMDPTNNRKANIQVLCPNCHRRTHYDKKSGKKKRGRQ